MPENYDKVLIKGLSLDLSVGIYDHEKAAPQRVFMDICLEVACNKGKALKTIEDVVSYEMAVKAIRQHAASRHFDLLEELAEELAVLLGRDPRVLAVTLSLQKPDIIPGTYGVGIEIRRILR